MTGPFAANAYRDVGMTSDVLSTTGAGLNAILWSELVDLLRIAGNMRRSHDACGRALAILTQLDATLIGDVDHIRTMRAIFREIWTAIIQGQKELDPKRFQIALAIAEPIADAWSTVRARS